MNIEVMKVFFFMLVKIIDMHLVLEIIYYIRY